MSATQATTGFKAALWIESSTTPGTFLKISEIVDLSGPNRGQNFADATHMDSPNGYEEVLPTFKTAGEVTATMNFLTTGAANQSELDASLEAQNIRNYRLVYPNQIRRVSFAAYVGNLGDTIPHNDVMRRNVTLRISGAPVFEAHTP